MAPRVLWPVCILAAAILSGCGDKSAFGKGAAAALLEANPQMLEAEQVVITKEQVECGVKDELWDPPIQVSGERTTAKLTPRGRDLKFDDDVSVVEHGYTLPYAQVRGQVQLQVAEIVAITDGPNPKLKFVEAKVGVKMNNACFAAPLPVMGVKRSKFNPDVNPVFQVSFDGESWKVDRIRH